jgi:hypothetical protein
MPLVQGGPPEWVWERSADFLKSEVVPVHDVHGQTVYELRLSCGMEILRLQFFTCAEIQELARQTVPPVAHQKVGLARKSAGTRPSPSQHAPLQRSKQGVLHE